jgi:hypothetical protein
MIAILIKGNAFLMKKLLPTDKQTRFGLFLVYSCSSSNIPFLSQDISIILNHTIEILRPRFLLDNSPDISDIRY